MKKKVNFSTLFQIETWKRSMLLRHGIELAVNIMIAIVI